MVEVYRQSGRQYWKTDIAVDRDMGNVVINLSNPDTTDEDTDTADEDGYSDNTAVSGQHRHYG